MLEAKRLKIHLPSLGMGVGIALAVSAFFIIYYHPAQDQSANTTTQKVQNPNQMTSMGTITDNSSPVLGSNTAPITMVEFGDYQCFYCNKFFHDTESDIVKNYIDTGKVKMVFKDFTIIGQDSVTAANAAHCAEEQGKFWEYHDMLYTNWSGENTGWASSQNLYQFASKVGLNENQFDQCMISQKYMKVIQGSVSDARSLGLTGTPDFFIIASDRSVTKIVGAQPYQVFDEVFKSKLK